MQLHLLSGIRSSFLQALSALPFAKPMGRDHQDVDCRFRWGMACDPRREIGPYPPANKKDIIDLDVRSSGRAAILQLQATLLFQRLAEQLANLALTVPLVLDVENVRFSPEITARCTSESLMLDLIGKESADLTS